MERLTFSCDGRIGRLTLNRPDKYNAFDEEMVREMETLFAELMYNEEVGVLILDGGQAKGFCAGLDMQGYGPEIFAMRPVDAYNAQARMSRLMLAMRRIPQPVICCVHGAAAGIGFSLTMASDIRILADNARFSAAYINIGLGGADMASSYFLPRLIGSGRANEYLLTGNWMGAEEAMALGFASRVVPREAMIPTATELATIMLSKNPLGIRMTKEAINANIDAGGLEACLQMEDRNQMLMAFAMHNPNQ
ncbi:enoyl-CoA hydratase/isomerase family protein [Desulfoluna butyratoxydans]|uniref:Crotonase superfamily n=1 Tax=Desulfoluna butyratoxydans TaxID=231438 RepID=A0A4V6ILA8_9BACT|nr:enoyl-CoA hydratase/isomerase family protein [Desulfoluna butyratoxydans]VFQ44478.1 crotonase superfamily [Desulfoluna butyratoxydans]